MGIVMTKEQVHSLANNAVCIHEFSQRVQREQMIILEQQFQLWVQPKPRLCPFFVWKWIISKVMYVSFEDRR